MSNGLDRLITHGYTYGYTGANDCFGAGAPVTGLREKCATSGFGNGLAREMKVGALDPFVSVSLWSWLSRSALLWARFG